MRSFGESRPRKSVAGFSLRAASAAASAAVFLLLGLTVGGLLVASGLALRSTEAIVPDARAIVVSNEIDRLLREHDALQAVSGESQNDELERVETSIERDIADLLVEMKEYAGSETEREVLSSLTADSRAYFAEHDLLERDRRTRAELVATLRPLAERVLQASALLRRINEDDLRRSQERARAAQRFQQLIAIASLAAFALATAFLIASVRRLLLRILAVVDALRGFRTREPSVRAPLGRLRELNELAVGFNDMATTIEQQRRDQLTFLAAVAHDLRNPLAALTLLMQRLGQDAGERAGDRFRRALAQIDRLARMVGDLLDTARIEAGELALVLVDFDLRDAARSMVELYAPTTTMHEIQLDLPADSVTVRGDVLRLEQVISNLLSNAIKYSPTGGPVNVSVRANRAEAKVSVSDSGIGIPAEQLSVIFEPFRRSHPTAEIAGVGLGLSIVKRIVAAHGGQIEVESEPGRGSTFTMRLPLVARDRSPA